MLLRSASPLDYTTLAPRPLSSRPTAVSRHRHILSLEGFRHARVRSASGEGVALHVGGLPGAIAREVVYEPAPNLRRSVGC